MDRVENIVLFFFPLCFAFAVNYYNVKQEGHDGPEIAHLSLLTKHAPSSFPVT